MTKIDTLLMILCINLISFVKRFGQLTSKSKKKVLLSILSEYETFSLIIFLKH